ncbi:MAG: glycosyltransferase family 4 protein [Bacillota bacterium]|nr:glycosyltransferase family 4 protein [Bacillota bacterium]
MKFSFIQPHLRIFGGIRRIIELTNHLIALGHVVTIYHPDGTPCQWLKSLAKTKKLSEIGEDAHEILVYTHPLQNDVFTKTPAKLKVYYILHAHHLNYAHDIVLHTYRQPGVHKVTCSKWVSEQVKPFLCKMLPVVYGGVNRDIFHPIPDQKKEFDIIFYGSKRPYKGTSTILEACRIGGFSYDCYEGKKMKQPQMAHFITKARIFVSGSWWEGWNNCSLEAMACKVPVVTTDCGGNREFAIDKITAMVIPPKKPKLMAEKINYLLKNPKFRGAIAINGYKKSLEYRWEDSASAWENLMMEYLKNPLI